MTVDGFRKLALALPQAREFSHLDHPDIRVGKRIFATLGYPDPSSGMVKLAPSQQAKVMALYPLVFRPVNGAWGAGGSTIVKLRAATRLALWPAMLEAWKNHATPALLK